MKLILKNFLLTLTVFIISCSPAGSSFAPSPIPVIPAEISTGSGTFIFSFNNFDVEVFYHVPVAYTASSKVVFALHGGSRDAEGVRNNMIQKSIEYNFVLIAPKFSSQNFSLGDGYNLGNVYEDGDNPSNSTLNDEVEWSFSIIEPLFDSVVSSLSLIEEKYNLFGFSAGAQFVHRFIQFKPNARFNKVVAGAAGWYTVPENNIPFPYGLNNSILSNSNLSNLLSKDLYIQVGALDNDPNSAGLRHNEYADAQGLNRVTRAVHFFESGQNIAETNNYNLNWSLHIIQGAGHNLIPNADNACELMFN
tara:strand:- start:1421 stop:2338 length:918 start_codon:yes stop_codon:yes gene_type:complete